MPGSSKPSPTKPEPAKPVRAPVISLRPFESADLPAIAAIYADEVRSGTATYDLSVPDDAVITAQWQARVEAGYPAFVALVDGEVSGYAFAGPYRSRPGYRWTVENSVYIAGDRRGLGMGGMLLGMLVLACTRLGYRQMIAVIGDAANAGSIAMHVNAGFKEVARFPGLGRKFGRWLDQVYLLRPLGDGTATPPDQDA